MEKSQKLLKDLEDKRGSLVISLVYSEHAEMSMNDASLVYEVLKNTLRKRDVKNGKVERIDLIIDSLGGEAGAAYKIVNIIRNFASEFNTIIIEKAKSAATLLTLGSDKIYMMRFSELGPIDPIVTHPIMTNIMIPSRSVEKFIDNVLPTLLSKYGQYVAEYFMKIDYNHVGFCKAAIEESEKYAEILLRKYHLRGKSSKEINAIIKTLTSYPSHDFVLMFNEAKEISLNVELLPLDEEDIVWKLYQVYSERLNDVVLIAESADYTKEVKKPKITIW